jgi:Fe-S-cluster containining protein
MWQCKHDGDCCKKPGEVVVTHAEQAEIERAASPSVALSWLPHEDARFVRLKAGPCPLYDGKGCSVYSVRPFSCRRFACVREDYSESYDWRERTLNREQKRRLIVIQRHAQRWARSHDWPES